nr:uncharacterized protein LOC112743457 [Arachis hypogaea]XP_025693199.1 uncharacterized protein LOC112795485 [Arachis hypogaea]
MSTPPGAPYSCDGCKEGGCGRSYRCEEKNCRGYVLHEECASAVLHRENPVSHSFFKGEVFAFLEKPLGRPRDCDACRMEVKGFVYHRKATKDVDDTGLDLHPCCSKLRDNISYEESHATKTLTLQQNVPKKCRLCERKKFGDDNKVKGWSYVTSDGDCFHVFCFKDLFLEKLKEEDSSQEKAVVSRMQTNNVTGNNMKVVKKVGGKSNSKGSEITKVVAKTATTVVVKLLFSLILGGGHPIALLPALVGLFSTSSSSS